MRALAAGSTDQAPPTPQRSSERHPDPHPAPAQAAPRMCQPHGAVTARTAAWPSSQGAGPGLGTGPRQARPPSLSRTTADPHPSPPPAIPPPQQGPTSSEDRARWFLLRQLHSLPSRPQAGLAGSTQLWQRGRAAPTRSASRRPPALT